MKALRSDEVVVGARDYTRALSGTRSDAVL
jgi:hypothetical protein